MGIYVDGYVVPVPKKNLAKYKKFSNLMGKVCIEHGALEFTECVADDVKKGKITSFPQSVKLKSNETVIFSWVTFKSRKDRDRVNSKVMKDPRLGKMMNPKNLPFDGMRMFWGGFKSFISKTKSSKTKATRTKASKHKKSK